MTSDTNKQNGRYIYAIVAGAEDRTYSPVGVESGSVYSVSDGRVAAVVSDVPNKKIRPQRRNLAAHQGVLRELMRESTPLPMAFGVIADGSEAVRSILAQNQTAFLDQLNRVAGKMEMGLRISWDVPNIFEYFVNTNGELRMARDNLFGPNREPSQEDKLEVGRMFDRILNEDREAHADRVEEILSSRCYEIRRNPPRNEREVVSLTCLIGREGEKDFEAGVFQAAERFDNNYSFDYTGPWAPHNFVNLEIPI